MTFSRLLRTTALSLAVAGLALPGAVGAQILPRHDSGTAPTEDGAPPPMTALLNGAQVDSRGVPTIAPIVAAVDDAVVNISVTGSAGSPAMRAIPNLPDNEEDDSERRSGGVGSGVIVDAEAGFILTNAHVIENGEEIRVSLRDGRVFDATVMGADSATDIAVLRIPAEDLTEIPTGDSEALLVGDLVLAIGNPFGLGGTVTSGIVSALGRSGINPGGYEDFIQTDASINPGNSGGALITLDGRLVGINTAILAPAGGNVGVGFAVPIDMAHTVMDQILDYGEVQRALLGVRIRTVTPDLAAALDLEDSAVDPLGGVLVASVGAGTAAETAELQTGDVIVSVDGDDVDGAADLRRRVGLMRPGSVAQFTFLRGGDVLTREVTLGALDTDPEMAAMTVPAGPLAGVTLVPGDVPADDTETVTGPRVDAIDSDSPAAESALEEGDVLVRVGGTDVATPREALDAFAAIEEEGLRLIGLEVLRDGRTRIVLVPR